MLHPPKSCWNPNPSNKNYTLLLISKILSISLNSSNFVQITKYCQLIFCISFSVFLSLFRIFFFFFVFFRQILILVSLVLSFLLYPQRKTLYFNFKLFFMDCLWYHINGVYLILCHFFGDKNNDFFLPPYFFNFSLIFIKIGFFLDT